MCKKLKMLEKEYRNIELDMRNKKIKLLKPEIVNIREYCNQETINKK